MIRDLWSHGKFWKWEINALYGHVRRLFDSQFSTKEASEDLLGTLSDHRERDNKNPFCSCSPERDIWIASTAIQWDQDPWPTAHLLEGDMTNKAFSACETVRVRSFSASSRTST